MQPESAVAVREDTHPIIAKIDAKMPEIAQMLPEGMSAERFRRVVVQALVRNPDLWQCTPISVVSAIVEAAQLGLEPTGVLGRAWMLPYNKRLDDGTWVKEAKLIPGYRGYSELAWRADRILVTTGAVRTGDEFAYQRGTDAFLRHVPASDDPDREANDANITDFWAMYTLPDGRSEFDVMSRKAVERIRDKARKKNPVWDSDFSEMGRKTVLRRLLKVAPLSPEVQRILARDEEIDFDTPVERVPDPKRAELRDRISQRTAAIRGDSTGESEGSEPLAGNRAASERARHAAGAEPGESSSSPPAAPRSGDPWMRRLHAVAAERGMDHDDLHQWAVQHFRVASLSDLSVPQRATFMELVERMPVMPQPSEGVPPSGGTGAAVDEEPVAAPDTRSERARGAASATPEASSDDPPVAPPPAAPTDAEILAAAGEGAELLPPDYDADPDAYKAWYDALPSAQRAALRGQGRSPRQLADVAKQARPDAEQLRSGLES